MLAAADALADVRMSTTASLREFELSVIEYVLEEMSNRARMQFTPEYCRASAGDVGVLSLSADPANLLMWSHYAAAHTGLVFEFDSTHAFFDARTVAVSRTDALRESYQLDDVQPAQYRDRPEPVFVLDAAETAGEALRAFRRATLYTKNALWSYEREWRLVRPLALGDPALSTLQLFRIPPECLTRVVLGLRTSPQLGERVRRSLVAWPTPVTISRARRDRDVESWGVVIEDLDDNRW